MPARLLPLAVLLLAAATSAQPARTVPVGDEVYDTIERLQRRGHLLALHPTALPYTEAEVTAALAELDDQALDRRETEWADLVRQRIGVATPGPDALAVRADIGVLPQASTSARLDGLRPVRAERSFPVGDGAFYTQADAHVAVGAGPLVAQLGVLHSLYANDDPDGLDVVNRAMMRNEENYLAYRGQLADVAVGRVGTHWGAIGRDALTLSDNPRPFDAVHLRLGGGRVAVRSVLGQLDSARPDGTFSDTIGQRPGDLPNDQPRVDRFFAAHRFDWRPSRRVALTVVESAVYSGANADPSLAYLVPTAAFAFLVDNTPKNVENNGAVGAMLWAQWRAWTLQGQVFVDDFDVVTGTEPAAAALTGSLVRADALPGLDLEAGLTAVTARAYNAPQPEGTMVYALRGLATEFSDYVHARVRADWFAAPGLRVSPGVDALWQGALSIESPYPANDQARTILTGTVTRTLRLAVDARYQTNARWWARADLGVNRSGDPFAQGVHGIVTVGARLGDMNTVNVDL